MGEWEPHLLGLHKDGGGWGGGGMGGTSFVVFFPSSVTDVQGVEVICAFVCANMLFSLTNLFKNHEKVRFIKKWHI